MAYFWRDIEVITLEDAKTAEDVAILATVFLEEIKKDKKEVAMISGPRETGGLEVHKANLDLITHAISVARRHNLSVFDPQVYVLTVKNMHPLPKDEHKYFDALERFYKKVFESNYIDTVLFLPEWKTSTEASWEYAVAEKYGMKAKQFPYDWLVMI